MKDYIIGSSLVLAGFLVICTLIYYFVSYKNLKSSKKYYEDLHKNLKVGKKIEFCGGIYGSISAMKGDEVEVYIAKDTIITISRYVITKIMD